MNLKYLVVEQKIVGGVFQTLTTPKDTEDEAINHWHYCMWYNGQDVNCTEFTVTVQGPVGEWCAGEHVNKVKTSTPEPTPEPTPEEETEPEVTEG